MTMVPISSIILNNTAVNEVVFYNIPQTYSHLHLRVASRTGTNAGTDYFILRFNENVSDIYRSHALYTDGSGVYSYDYGLRSYSIAGWQAAKNSSRPHYGYNLVDIFDYTSTSKNKVFQGVGGSDINTTGSYLNQISGLFASTSAITNLTVRGYNGELTLGSRFDLYGISTSGTTGA